MPHFHEYEQRLSRFRQYYDGEIEQTMDVLLLFGDLWGRFASKHLYAFEIYARLDRKITYVTNCQREQWGDKYEEFALSYNGLDKEVKRKNDAALEIAWILADIGDREILDKYNIPHRRGFKKNRF